MLDLIRARCPNLHGQQVETVSLFRIGNQISTGARTLKYKQAKTTLISWVFHELFPMYQVNFPVGKKFGT